MDAPWLDHYPNGVPAQIDIDRYQSLADLLDQSCRRFPERTAYICMGTRLSYRKLDALSRQFAAWLQHKGFEKGDRLAIMMPNFLAYPVVLFGALRAGCVVINCNPLYSFDELKHKLVDAEAKGIVVAENVAATLEKCGRIDSLEQTIIARIGEFMGPLKGRAIDFAARSLKKMIPAWSLEGHQWLADAIKQGKSLTFTPPTLTHQDTACLQYTGGTTGLAKGAIISHGNLLANLTQLRVWIHHIISDESPETIITALPLYHIFALTVNCLLFVSLGACSLLIPDPRDMKGFIKVLKKHHFTCFSGVNTLYNGLLNRPELKEVDFSPLKIAIAGGMALQGSVAQRWEEATGTSIIQGYGLTEASPVVCVTPLTTPAAPFNGSIGFPLPSTHVSIRDEHGQPLALNETGELCVKGPQVVSGYWKHAEENATTFFDDGYLRTGDIARIDEKGFVFLVDRKKDMILVSGFNVYPNEVEEVITRHPGVSEAAAIGVPDDNSGERVKVFVIRRDPDLDEQTLRAWCKDHLSGYKVPRYIEFRDDLPRSNVGKILRRELRVPTDAHQPAHPANIPD
ncbi:AMP-binding protein [Carnimonas bestiolae]|uniref:AMP-binding protein n=1 Tax=Carnimonas bestiolae TaxID=3402172 RepID=UPI003EDB88B7